MLTVILLFATRYLCCRKCTVRSTCTYIQSDLAVHSLLLFNPFLHIYSFSHIEEKRLRKKLWKKVKLLKMSNFTFFHNVFCGICILKSFNSHISIVVCSFFEFGTVSKWCRRKWVNQFLWIKSHTMLFDWKLFL